MHKQKYWMINWVNGMKINKSVFQAEQNAFIYEHSQHTKSLLTDHNWGLLPTLQNDDHGLELLLSIDKEQQLHLRVQHCLALTRGGHYIEFDEDTALYENVQEANIPELFMPLNEVRGKSSACYVVLTMNPYDRIAHGLADPREAPARKPYTMPAFHLSLVPEQEAGQSPMGLFHLPVGRLKTEEQKVVMDESFIPPCSSIGSHYKLMNMHAELVRFYTKMEMDTLTMIQKIVQLQKAGDLATIVQKLCENIRIIIASDLARLRTTSVHQPPVDLVCMVSSLARNIKNTLDCYQGTRKEEFTNYCTNRCNVSQGELESAIVSLSNHPYNHLDINGSVEKILGFTQILSDLFEKLERLDFLSEWKVQDIYIDTVVVPGRETVLSKSKSLFHMLK